MIRSRYAMNFPITWQSGQFTSQIDFPTLPMQGRHIYIDSHALRHTFAHYLIVIDITLRAL